MLVIGLLSLLAGVLTALAPCVLPFLPIIIGGSVEARGGRKRPFLIAASLIVSLLLFTLLLKATTLFININPMVWAIASGTLVIILGITMLIPDLWAWVMEKTGLGAHTHELLHKAQGKESNTLSAILTGAALGPVFSSCSPTYAWVIATVLPAQPVAGFLYLSLYCLGLAAVLLLIGLAGRALVTKLGWAANPRGWFQKVLAVIFIVVGLLIVTGVDRKVEAWATSWAPSLTQIEEKLLPANGGDGNGDSSSLDSQFPLNQAAPELQGIKTWLNSNPLTLKQLRGKVVLIDFWTYSCINCQRTQPYLNAWYDQYHQKGFEIIGVHAPEFAFEKVPDNVKRAIKDANIKYPVALDNDFLTWRAYNNQYWPAKYLIDKNGNIRYTHFGEGGYDQTEKAIQKLLNLDQEISQPKGKTETASREQSPETYLGLERASGFVGTPVLGEGMQTYTPEAKLQADQWTLGGSWTVDHESVTADQEGATLTYRFRGKNMFLVMGAQNPAEVKITVDGVPNPGGEDVHDGVVKVHDYRLYRLVNLDKVSDGVTVTITFPKGVTANAFTFG